MGQNNFSEIIQNEGITVKELYTASCEEVCESAIRRYLKGAVPKDAYKGKIKNAINKLKNKEYTISDIWKN